MVLIMVLIDLIFPNSVLFSNLIQMTRQRHYQAIDKHQDVPKYYPWYLFRWKDTVFDECLHFLWYSMIRSYDLSSNKLMKFLLRVHHFQ